MVPRIMEQSAFVKLNPHNGRERLFGARRAILLAFFSACGLYNIEIDDLGYDDYSTFPTALFERYMCLAETAYSINVLGEYYNDMK